MITLILKRIASGSNGTFGVIVDEVNIPFCVSLERPWMNNADDVSCIPPGTYTVKRTIKPEHGECFEVQSVPSRGSILIHAGNTITDSKGCILLGKNYTSALGGIGMPGIELSKITVDEFMNKMNGIDSFTLRIIDATT